MSSHQNITAVYIVCLEQGEPTTEAVWNAFSEVVIG